MRYFVLWQRDAEAELAQLWMEAEDRSALRQAADDMDRLLSADPLGVGESRHGEYRIAFFPPLGFEFRVSEPDRRVVVVRVWRIR